MRRIQARASRLREEADEAPPAQAERGPDFLRMGNSRGDPLQMRRPGVARVKWCRHRRKIPRLGCHPTSHGVLETAARLD